MKKSRDVVYVFWNRLWKQAGLYGYADDWFRILDKVYNEPHRKYHNFDHLAAAIAGLKEFKYACYRPVETGMALMFHDLIYCRSSEHNELLSAEFAYYMLSGLNGSIDADVVYELILATDHKSTDGTDDQRLIASVDIIGFGYSWDKFMENNKKVKEETGLDEQQFNAGTVALFRHFLERDSIFPHSAVDSVYGERARENLSRTVNMIENPN